MTDKGHILLIDDDESVLGILSSALQNKGYSCTLASSGEDGLELFDESVDLAIVDVNLPAMDGVAVTQQLKERAGARFVPVLVITGADEVAERLRAFKGGCDDFLSKPVNLFELEARVRSLVVRRRQHAELEAANKRLRDAQRKKQDLAALVVHDLRNPLSAIQGNVELLMEELGGANDFVREALSDCHKLCGRALFLVAGLLDVEELSEGLLHAEPAEVPIRSVIAQASPHHKATMAMRNLSMEFDVPEDLTANVDPDLLARLVENLLDNSVRYAPRGGRVAVSAWRDSGQLVICVGNDGPPVPPLERDRIFGRYYRLEARRAGARANRGLGLYFCKLAVEAHGGTITATEKPGLPACFELRIPQ